MTTNAGIIRRVFRRMPPGFKAAYANQRFRSRLENLDATLVVEHDLDKPGSIAFAIVHFNAPDYLLLNVKRLSQLYPDSKVYVLDNGSEPEVWSQLIHDLIRQPTVTYFKVHGESEHAVGLQFLLEYSAKQGDRYLCFLDQDCILINRLDPLLHCFNNHIDLIGPTYFNFPGMIHSSFALLQPQTVWALYGRKAFEFHKTHSEPMFGISQRLAGRVLCLDHDFGKPHEGMSTYSYKGTQYAWHGWYSSRTSGLGGSELLDGKPASYWREASKRNYEYMREAIG